MESEYIFPLSFFLSALAEMVTISLAFSLLMQY